MKKRLVGKKILGLSMATVMMVSLSACGMGEGEQEEAIKAADGNLGAYEETVVCNMGRSTIANPKFPEGDTYENNAYTRYVKEKLNVEIKDSFEANGEDYDRQVSLAIASSELPDVMCVRSKEVLDELVENDLIADLTEVYEKYASEEIKAIYDSYDGRCLDAATYDGRLMALPGTNYDSAPCEVFIRQDWVDKLGMTIDEDGDMCLSIDELEKIAQTFVEKDPGNTGNAVGMAFTPYLTAGDYGGSGYTMTAIGSAYKAFPGSWLVDENGKVYNGATTKEMKNVLAKLAEWFEEGLIDPQFGTRTWDDITTLLTNGQMGIVFGPWHLPDWLLNNVRSMDSKAAFSAYTVSDENGKVNVIHNNACGGYIVVRKGYSNPEVMVKIANLFFDEIINNKNIATEEPEVYKYISTVDNSARPIQVELNKNTYLIDEYTDIKNCVDGTITMDEVRSLESKTCVESIQRYLSDPQNSQVADWSKYTSRMHGMGLIQKLSDENRFEWYSPVFFDMTDTMGKKGADLNKLQEETFVAIVTGAEPIDKFDEFVATWSERGGEQITKEVQEIVDNK